MTRRIILFSLSSAAFAGVACGFQGRGKRISPHETVSLDLNGKHISIVYGRPSLKGRSVGKEVAPFGQVWRLGADEATKLTVSAPATIGSSLQLAPGSYSLFAIPGVSKWTLIVNKVAEQWGAFSYEESQDAGRFDVPVSKPASPVEEFTISLSQESSDTARLTMAWGDEEVSTTLKVS